MNALAIPSTFTINVVIDFSSVEAVLTRVLSAFLQLTDTQSTDSLSPPVPSSLPAADEARAEPAGSNPVEPKPARTRRSSAEIAALKAAGLPTRKSAAAMEAEKQATAITAPPPAASVAVAATAPSVPLVAAAQPAQMTFDPFGPVAAPVAAPSGLATPEQVTALQRFILDEFMPHKKGGNPEYVRIRAELGNPMLRGDVSLAVVTQWEAALRKQIA